MKTPLISIITVVYNGRKTLEDTIVSVVDQSYQHIEYIIVDGKSTDGTIDIIQKYKSRISLWVSESDKGIYDAMNKGIKMSSGDFIYFLGADDRLASHDIISQVVSRIGDKNEVVYGDVLMKHSGKRYDGGFGALKLVTRNIPHQALFYPKDVFDVHKFSMKYRIFADYHLNLILFNDKRWAFRYIPLVVCIFDDSGTSGSLQRDIAFEEDLSGIVRANFSPVYYWYRILRSSLKKLVSTKG